MVVLDLVVVTVTDEILDSIVLVVILGSVVVVLVVVVLGSGHGSSLVGSGRVLGGGWLGPWYPIMYPFVGVQII